MNKLGFVEKKSANRTTESIMHSVNYGVCVGQVLARVKVQGSLFFLLLFPVWRNALGFKTSGIIHVLFMAHVFAYLSKR